MPLIFKDTVDDLEFDYKSALPAQRSRHKLSAPLLTLYGLTRNALYDSYASKALSPDIIDFPIVFHEKSCNSGLRKNACEPLYQYCVAASTGIFKSWLEHPEVLQYYSAKNSVSGLTVGFIQFVENDSSNNKIVYIAQAAVSHTGQSIGRRLVQCVLHRYPAGTEFHILTRLFNTEAKNLYQKRLGFNTMEASAIIEWGYSPDKYCGYRWVSTQTALREIEDSVVSRLSASKSPD